MHSPQLLHSLQQCFLASNREPPKRETYRSKNRTGPVTWLAVQQISVNKKETWKRTWQRGAGTILLCGWTTPCCFWTPLHPLLGHTTNVTLPDDTLAHFPFHPPFCDFVTNGEKSSVFLYQSSRLSPQIDPLLSQWPQIKYCNLENLEVRVLKYLPPALSHACRFWGGHLVHLDFEADLFGKLKV